MENIMDNELVASAVSAVKSALVSGSRIGVVRLLKDSSDSTRFYGSRGAGLLVSAVIFFVQGRLPNKKEFFFLTVGHLLEGAVCAIGLAIAKIWNAAVDANTRKKLAQVQQSEPQSIREHIMPCGEGNGGTKEAMEVASHGGTAWEHPNGLWVFVTASDYTPKIAKQVYQPRQPIMVNGKGRFSWWKVKG